MAASVRHRSAHVLALVALAAISLLALAAALLNRASNAWQFRYASDSTPATLPFVPSTRPLDDWEGPKPKSAGERVDERRRMVQTQIARPIDGRQPVRNQAVINAMLAVPRHVFVPQGLQHLAYADSPLPIGHDQTISQPYIVALMSEALQIRPGDKVLEIGTGSGYQAAVLAHLTPFVYTIEIIEPLGKSAAKILAEQGYSTVKTRIGDGYQGWKEHAPFDAIIVTCAAEELPPPLWEQLAPGGRICIPVGPAHQIQSLLLITKTADGKSSTRSITEVRFVPLIRQPP